MPEQVALDFWGNFNRSSEAVQRRRFGRQLERDYDLEINEKEDAQIGRRADVENWERDQGIESLGYGENRTNREPVFQRLMRNIRNRSSRKITAEAPAASSSSSSSSSNIWDQEASREVTGSSAPSYNWDSDEYLEGGYQDGGRVGIAGRGTPPTTPGNYSFRGGGRVAIPYQDGGSTRRRPMTMEEHREAALWRNTPIVQRLSGPSPPTNAIPGRDTGGGVFGAAGRFVRRASELNDRVGVGNTIREAELEALTRTTQARQRESYSAGREGRAINPTEETSATDILFSQPIESTAQRRTTAIPDADQEVRPLEDEILSPDGALAKEILTEGQGIAQEAAKTPTVSGDIDFSKGDIRAEDIPNVTVNDWIEYRKQSVRNLMLQGKTAAEANQEINTMQQQGAANYLAQATAHYAGGDLRGAAAAMQMSYQYFPNGSNIRFGIHTGQDGQRVLVGMGTNEETGEMVGTPSVITAESLAVLRANFEDPNKFLAWTKDQHAEDLEERKFEETLREGESMRTLREDQGAYYRGTGAGNEARGRAAGQGSVETVEEAQAIFWDVLEDQMIGRDKPVGMYLWSIMTQVKRANVKEDASRIGETILRLYMDEENPDELDAVLQRMGIAAGPPPVE